ncbi:hypothetical protein [Stappia sp. ES.058]|uniref:hypothetical protein n=1 Tax=Stappia sp. ES.058 TaxID=1881061 RepID=UPI00087B8DB2|nr:hypothetical protein [Stappia sp. ES.058]SDU45744.1 hypothetical protein SAMN05428979_4017 [Stappia sp. ES.058]
MDDRLEITINRRRFDRDGGVAPTMTADDLATLAGIPAQNAIVERETGPRTYEALARDSSLPMRSGLHFLVTRKFVMGG